MDQDAAAIKYLDGVTVMSRRLDDVLPVPIGSIITFTEDEYSSYRIVGTFRSLQELRPGELRGSYLNKHPDQRGEYRFHPVKFVAWLESQGYIEHFHSWEWHIPSSAGIDK